MAKRRNRHLETDTPPLHLIHHPAHINWILDCADDMSRPPQFLISLSSNRIIKHPNLNSPLYVAADRPREGCAQRH